MESDPIDYVPIINPNYYAGGSRLKFYPPAKYIGAAVGAGAYYLGYEGGKVSNFIDNTITNGILNLPQGLNNNQGSVVIKHKPPTTVYAL